MTAARDADAPDRDTSGAPAGLDRPVAPQDVEFAYFLALGRPVESEAARDGRAAAGGTVSALLADLLVSAEFEDGVAGALARGGLAPGRYLNPLGAVGRDWARPLFGPDVVDPARTWLELLLRLQAEGRLAALGAAYGRPALAKALAPVAQARARGEPDDAAVVAGVDGFDGERLRGWAVDLADPDRAVRLELWIDGRFARTLTPDRFRRDLQDRYGGSGRVEFDAALPLGASDAGRRLRLEVRTLAGRTLAATTEAAVAAARLDAFAAVAAELAAVRAVLERLERAVPDLRARAGFTLAGWDDYARTYYPEPTAEPASGGTDAADGPAVAVRVRRGSGSAAALEAALRSLAAQTHAAWTARVDPDALDDPGQLAALLATLGRETPGRLAVAAMSEDVLAGALVVFMSADDRLAPDALAAFARARRADPQARLLYADDDRWAPAAPGAAPARADPRLKPPYDPYLLLQENYVGSVYATDAALVVEIGAAEGLGDHARLLALAQAAGRAGVRHVPRVLSHRGAGEDPPADADAVAAGLGALGLRAAPEPHADVVGQPRRGALRLRAAGVEGVTASVVISTRDRLDLLRPCVESLERTRAANRVRFELVVVDNGGVEPAGAAYLRALAGRPGVRVLRDPAPFNWAAINTRAALQATGEVLMFLNDDTLAVSPGWCDELCLWALAPGVGAAGARLLYDDGTIQHAGVVLGRGGSARHEGVGEPGGEGGYLGRRQLAHAASAVTGACLATRAEVFRRLDGFDAARYAVAFNDMDYCLRAAEAGLDIVYTPHAVFTHFESKSRGFGDPADRAGMGRAREELESFQRRHADALRADRWMNPHFVCEAPAFTLLGPPPTA